MKKNILLTLTLAIMLLLSKLLLTTNFTFVFKWWLTLLILGTISLPITTLIFNKISYGKGFLSKIIGFAIPSLIFWYLSYMKLLQYSKLTCWLVIAFWGLINLIILIKFKNKIFKEANIIKKLLITEIIFLAIFTFWSYVRSFYPYIDYTTEKFMNYGFLNALFNSTYMPAQDMWLSGNHINYYYFGQYIASFLTKISFSSIAEGFNLSIATINTFTVVLPLTIGYNLGINLIDKNKNKISKAIPVIIAILCAFAVSVGGTLYYPIYNFILERDSTYYYWEDSRYIGYRPDTNDKTINEILPYSNVVGDLHAHHIDTMFVFFNLTLLLNLLFDKRKENIKNNLLNLNLIFIGITLGIQKMTNFWDFPIYLTVATITILFNNISQSKFNKKSLLTTLLQFIELIVIAEITSLPFTLDLYMSATQVCLTHVTSPLYKLFVLWGLPAFCIILHIVNLISNFIKNKDENKFFKKLSTYISQLNKADLFIFIIGCCAIGLIIIPEIIYIKDIYDEEYKRANTMYKLCFQAEIMFDICTTYILTKFICTKSHILKKIISSLLLLAFLTTFGYGINAINYETNNFNKENVKSLTDTEGYIEKYHPAKYAAIQWIKENIDRNEIILEKPSGSYNINSHISVFTGNPTILGWHGHEWIWRANKDYSVPEIVDERWQDAHEIYSTSSEQKIKELIDKYNISYVYISTDSNKIVKNLKNLIQLGTIEYKNSINNETIYIIKISK